MGHRRTYADHCLNGPYSRFVQEHKTAGSKSIDMIRTSQPAGDFSDPATNDLVLTKMDCDFRNASFDFGGGLWKGNHRTDDLVLMPPDTARIIEVDDVHRVSLFAIPFRHVLGLLEEAAPNLSSDFGPLYSKPFRNPEISRLLTRLWHEAEADNPLGGLFAETAVQSLIIELLRAAHAANTYESPTYQLDAKKLKAVDELLDSSDIADASLADLAKTTGLSQFHFSRAFKAATGLSPHQYLIERRLARARDLLETSKDTIADIAYACGFSSQSHMTTTFSKQLGITPAKYRKERCE